IYGPPGLQPGRIRNCRAGRRREEVLITARRPDAPKVVKAFWSDVYSAWFAMVSGAAARVCWVTDKTGSGHEGRLLIGHAQQVRLGSGGGRRIVRRPARGGAAAD